MLKDWGWNFAGILLMDANAVMEDGNDLDRFRSKLGLTDIVTHFKPDLQNDATYLWGSKRLDYILVSNGVLDAAVDAGHHPFPQYIVSDHKGVYVHFAANQLFVEGGL